jgi:hypothetical protein
MELIRGKKLLNKSLPKTGRSVSDICKNPWLLAGQRFTGM